MERPKLAEGLVWREKPSGGYYSYIYFKKQYRHHKLRGSSKTSDPEEAEKRLRKLLSEIDAQEVYGIRPKRTFEEACIKFFEDLKESPNNLKARTIKNYGDQADLLVPELGNKVLPIWKDDMKEFIKKRYKEGSSARTINLSIEFVRLINRNACYKWKDENTRLSWIEHCPILSLEKGPVGQPVIINWEKQDVFFDLLPGIKRKASIVAVNTGLRDFTLTNLQWSWERYSEVLKETVFEIPGEYMKNGKPMTLILNRIARKEVESLRGRYPEKVFGDIPVMTDKAWYRAWKEAGLPVGKEWKKGVHNLRHTFSTRLRDAGVDERDVEDLMHHLPKTVTRHYSAPDLRRLKECLERLVPSPTLSVVAQNSPSCVEA